MPTPTFDNPAGLSTPRGYTHVVDVPAGRTLYISGQVAFDAEGNVVGKGDVRAQTEQVFRNLEIALKSAGSISSPAANLAPTVASNAAAALRITRNCRNEPHHEPAACG